LALLAAFFHAINGFVIEISVGRITTDHIDTTFFFFLELGIYLSLRFAAQNRFLTFLLIGIVMGLAVLTKWYIGFFILPMFGLANLSKSSLGKVIVQSCMLALIAFPIFYSWQYYIHQSFPKEAAWESNYNFKHLFEAIEGHGQSWWYYLDKSRICWNELIYVVFLTFVVRWWRQPMQFPYYFLGFWVLVPYIIFSWSATKMQGYVLWTAPAVFILLALFIVELPLFLANHPYFKHISIVIILLSTRYSLERIKPFNDMEHLRNQKQKIRIYQTQLKPRSVLFNTTQAIEIMFYTDFLAYERIPTLQEIKKAQQAGYAVGIIEGKSLSSDILKDTTILKISSNEIMLK
jgi:4-amino-4-deoxy-L-arabinose transferase